VFCWKQSANRFGIRAGFKERVLDRKFEDKAEDSLKKSHGQHKQFELEQCSSSNFFQVRTMSFGV
jgi:hypothetical protein